MRKLFLTCAMFLGCASAAPLMAQCGGSLDGSDDNFFGGARYVLTPICVNNDTALSILGETGSNNFRINGTIGTLLDCNQRLKIGAEYLDQKIKYKFRDGSHRRWRQQFAVGGKYQYRFNDYDNNYGYNNGYDNCCDCGCDWVKGIQLTGYYSHSQNHKLDNDDCGRKHIAGAWSWDLDAGLIFEPWCCSTLIISGGYDHACFKRHFDDRVRYSGGTATIEFNQKLFWGLQADINSHFKRSYNDIQAKLSWTRCLSCGELEIALYGGHVWGKNKLASSSNFGIELGFAFGIDSCCQFVGIDCCEDCCGIQDNDLFHWVRDGAVYLPEVLAISDQEET